MASKVKVNTVETESGSTLTLGKSGDTVTLASGASQSGFGRTGTVDWQTTPKTANFTAVNGEGYFCNTTSSAFTMTMPSGSAGAIVSIQDYNRTFATNNLTVAPASGEKINGGNASQNLVISTEGQGLTFVYVDSTVGWKTVHDNEFASGGTNFIDASGGTVTTCGNCKIHTFTGPGSFTVNKTANCSANNLVAYLVVAGGGSGGSANNNNNGASGAGAGGAREYKSPVTPYTSSPLDGNPSNPAGGGTAITITQQSYPITVGSGGAAASPINNGTDGSNSIFSTITSAGGAGGRAGSSAGTNGGSGSGGTGSNPGGNGNTPPVTPPQGKNGSAGNGSSGVYGGGGGGGATTTGTAGSTSSGGPGGTGATTHISGSPTAYAGGGAGGAYGNGPAGTGGTGGGGDGNDGNPANPGTSAGSGTANTGGGGGGNNQPAGSSGGGGSGIVIIRYKFQ